MDDIDRLFETAWRTRIDRSFEANGNATALSAISSEESLAKALTGQADIERDRNHDIAAAPLYEEAVRLYRRTDNVMGLVSALRLLGDTYQDRQDFDMAAPCYDEALTICRAMDDTPPAAMAHVLRSVALLYEAQGEPAGPLWEEALTLYDRSGVKSAARECRVHLKATGSSSQ